MYMLLICIYIYIYIYVYTVAELWNYSCVMISDLARTAKDEGLWSRVNSSTLWGEAVSPRKKSISMVHLVAFGTVFRDISLTVELITGYIWLLNTISLTMIKRNKSWITFFNSQKCVHFDCFIYIWNLKLTLKECENINSAAIINKLEYAEIANYWDLGDVSPWNCTFCHLIWNI